MAGEVVHVSVGAELSQGEYEHVNAHTLKLPMVVYTDSQTLDSDVVGVVANKATALTFTLPATTGAGKIYFIKNVGAGALLIDGNGSDTIDGEESITITQYDAVTIVGYAANKWAII